MLSTYANGPKRAPPLASGTKLCGGPAGYANRNFRQAHGLNGARPHLFLCRVNKQDRELHEEILRDGDHDRALAVSDQIKARIREAGIDPDTPLAGTEADIAALMAARRKSPGR